MTVPIRVYGFSNVDAQINYDLRYMGFGAGNSTPNSSQARLEKGKKMGSVHEGNA